MILECPNCETCYETPAVLPEEGRKVKCARCSHVWHAMPIPEPEPEPESEPEPELDVQNEIEPIAPDIFDDGGDLDFRDNEEDDQQEPIPEENLFEALNDEQSFGETKDEPKEEFGAIEEEVIEEPDEFSIQEEPVVQQKAPEIPVPPTMISVPRVSAGKLIAGWGALGVCVLATIALSYIFRVDIVKTLPTSAHIYAQFGVDVNVRGLEFKRIRYKKDKLAGRQVLKVTGEIINITNAPVEIPTVVFAFRDERGAELYYLPRKLKINQLPPGHQMPFSIQLPTPSKLVHSFELRFAKQRREGS